MRSELGLEEAGHAKTHQGSRIQLAASQIGEVLGGNKRLWTMVLVLIVVCLFFNLVTGGVFLSPRNLWNLAVQTSVVAIISTGMVLVIVSRNIDLSVGSLEAFLGMFGGYLQTVILPLDGPYTWWITILTLLAFGFVSGFAQGAMSAYFLIPSFVVTLGGLMFWRAAGWLFTHARTITPLDSKYHFFGEGSIGVFWSWILGAILIVLLASIALWRRSSRKKLGFELRPLWIEIGIIGLWAIVVIAGVATMNAYTYPKSDIGRGIPVPIVILLVVVLSMTYLATMTRFGRYIYGYGGNPEAAELAGVPTRRIIAISFGINGLLTAIGAIISTARLNATPLTIGELLELQAIAACVIGGASLSGGVGTVTGAILGALLIQTLQNGMLLLGVESSPQQIVMAGVLLAAVWLDVMVQRRR
jgi:D-xylose transport system permease protein